MGYKFWGDLRDMDIGVLLILMVEEEEGERKVELYICFRMLWKWDVVFRVGGNCVVGFCIEIFFLVIDKE